MEILTGLATAALATVVRRLRPSRRRRGRPWALPLERRVVVACTSLRTNLTVRELAAVFGISPAQVHRIVTDVVERMAAMQLAMHVPFDRRYSWVVDGTLVPTRDHRVAAKAKNYRWSCNAQLLIRRTDLRVIVVAGGGPGNRNDPIHYRGTHVERQCQHHGRVLADGGLPCGARARNTGGSGTSHPPRPVLAATSQATSTRRARHRETQGLACTSRPSSVGQPSDRVAMRRRSPPQPQT